MLNSQASSLPLITSLHPFPLLPARPSQLKPMVTFPGNGQRLRAGQGTFPLPAGSQTLKLSVSGWGPNTVLATLTPCPAQYMAARPNPSPETYKFRGRREATQSSEPCTHWATLLYTVIQDGEI